MKRIDTLNTKLILYLGIVVTCVSQLTAETPAVPAPAKTLTQKDNGAAVVLSRKSRLIIRLPTQPGTGYSWTPKGGSSLLRLVKSYVEPPTHLLPGGTETQVYVFTPIASGTDELELGYRRSWEHEQPPARMVRFTVTVD